MSGPRTLYAEHTWVELRELGARDDVVVVIPTATLEDHGHHLPIDTDVRLVEAISRGAVERFNAGGAGRHPHAPGEDHHRLDRDDETIARPRTEEMTDARR